MNQKEIVLRRHLAAWQHYGHRMRVRARMLTVIAVAEAIWIAAAAWYIW